MSFSLLGWFLSFFDGARDSAERIKKRALKRTVKALGANKYGKFFRVKSARAEPELAQFFYNVYKVLSPAQMLLQNAAQSAQLKGHTVLNFLDSTQLGLLERLSAENTEKRAKDMEPNHLERVMRTEFEEFARGFDARRINDINECYTLIMIIYKFVVYDYFFLLKKFDPQLTEHSFSREPDFNSIRGEAVVEELKDFLELTGALAPNHDWNLPLQILEKYKGREVINLKLWHSMLAKIRDVVHSEVFELIIRFVEKDPFWTWKPRVFRESIAGDYLVTLKGEIFDAFDLMVSAKRNALIEQYARAVFGNVMVNRLRYYTEQGGEIYKNKNFQGFIHAKALNYLIVFLNDVWQEMQDLYEIILIRGQWVSQALSYPLSESLRLLAVFPARIMELDGMFSERGFYGNKLKPAIMKYDRDKNLERSIARNLKSGNAEAMQVISDAIFNISVLDDGLKDLLEDYRKSSGTIILNWQELDSFSETNLEDRIIAMRDRLSNMLELLRVLSQNSNQDD